MVTPLTFLSRVPALLVALVLLGLMATTSGAAEGDTNRMSVEGSGKEANWDSSHPSISADGRFVAFDSLASNLVPGDIIEADRAYYDNYDVFLRDLRAGTTERLSIDRIGSRGENWIGYNPSISSDGSVVAFESIFDEYPWGPYLYYSVTVVDRQTEIRERWTVGEETYDPSISSDGRFVAFVSSASNLVANDTNNAMDVFVRDRQMGTPSG